MRITYVFVVDVNGKQLMLHAVIPLWSLRGHTKNGKWDTKDQVENFSTSVNFDLADICTICQ